MSAIPSVNRDFAAKIRRVMGVGGAVLSSRDFATLFEVSHAKVLQQIGRLLSCPSANADWFRPVLNDAVGRASAFEMDRSGLMLLAMEQKGPRARDLVLAIIKARNAAEAALSGSGVSAAEACAIISRVLTEALTGPRAVPITHAEG